MRVLLSAHGSRGDVEPLLGPAVRLRSLGAEVRVRALVGTGLPDAPTTWFGPPTAA
jgi:vancomycin aglycone glucosyltransferase